MGMRRKILAGFLSIAFLLFFSVIVTLSQFNRLTNATQALIKTSTMNIKLSKQMLDAVQEQNTALLDKIVSGGTSYDSLMISSQTDFDTAFKEVSSTVSDIKLLEAIYQSKQDYDKVSHDYDPARTAEENLHWFVTVYRSNYYKVTNSIKEYMVNADDQLRTQATDLGNRAYRVITPSILTLSVMLMIIGMFFIFIDIYFVKPVIRINKSLGDYLRLKLPFNVKFEGKDEVYQLKEKIDELISLYKKKRGE